MKKAPTACKMRLNAERPCKAQVAITVHNRSPAFLPFALGGLRVTWRSVTMNIMARSESLFAGSTPGVAANSKYASPQSRNLFAMAIPVETQLTVDAGGKVGIGTPASGADLGMAARNPEIVGSVTETRLN